VVGAINAYHAILAKASGYRAVYLSGGGVAAGSLGVPDLGISNLDDVLTDVRRITDVCDLPLLVDADTGFGASAFNVARTVKSLIKFGAAALHIEDQVGAKRCGHRPGKELVSKQEMIDRVKSAVDAKSDRTSSSSRAPTRSPRKASTPWSSARWRASRPAPTASSPRRSPTSTCTSASRTR
jgi:methylisocitrate lyase